MDYEKENKELRSQVLELEEQITKQEKLLSEYCDFIEQLKWGIRDLEDNIRHLT